MACKIDFENAYDHAKLGLSCVLFWREERGV